MRERSVGLGVMGFHSYLQANMIPWESVMAKVWNNRIFSHIKEQVDHASRVLAEERGACPDAAECGMQERFSNKTAIAPTASISIICGERAQVLNRLPVTALRIKPFQAHLMSVTAIWLNCWMKKAVMMTIHGHQL